MLAVAAPAAAAAPVPPPAEGGPARRKRLSAGWIAFIVVDVVLIVMAAAFAVQVLSSPPPTTGDLTAGPSEAASTPSASASEEPPAEDAQLAAFASPSGNITCSMNENTVTCGIAELGQQPAPVEGCEGTTGYVVTIDGEGKVALPCVAPADQPKAASGGSDVLDYGESRTEGDFTCTSADTGMSCQHDPSGRGFSIARAGIGTS
jgi:hypothetical protein